MFCTYAVMRGSKKRPAVFSFWAGTSFSEDLGHSLLEFAICRKTRLCSRRLINLSFYFVGASLGQRNNVYERIEPVSWRSQKPTRVIWKPDTGIPFQHRCKSGKLQVFDWKNSNWSLNRLPVQSDDPDWSQSIDFRKGIFSFLFPDRHSQTRFE